MGKILVTGGCGYIGSHTILDLLSKRYTVISVDNFSNAEPATLDRIAAVAGVHIPNYDVDLCDYPRLKAVFEENPDISGVIHFAALKNVGESVEQPIRYYHNNLQGLLHLLQVMVEHQVPRLIFSSSCSVYGNAEHLPVTENTPLQEAESPYARTKQMGEQIISDVLHSHPSLNCIILRYFNPAGAHESALIGEAPFNKASNLVPVITETAIGKREEMVVFGNDYDTRDGTCVRDYIHIMDLADAHTRALRFLADQTPEGKIEYFNLGIGQGVSVLEAIEAFEKVSTQPLNYRIGPRRPGDVVAVYADYSKAARLLDWQPKRTIEDIMRSAWLWEQNRSKTS